MREDLLHYIWKYHKLITTALFSTKNEAIVIHNSGIHNHLSGPDFFNARVGIGHELWAGNVEMHIKASDWYLHHHSGDPNYDNVILHVVWVNDVAVFRKDGSEIPSLELKNFIPEKVLASYHQLLNNKSVNFINCEKDIRTIDQFIMDNWLERLYFERLEKKSQTVSDLLAMAQNDWEKALFVLLLKNFGLKINSEAFLSLGMALDFAVVQKTRNNPFQLESILLGMAGLLDDDVINDEYFKRLRSEYHYLKKKFNLDATAVLRPEFFKLRPSNFPTIRLSQFASLYKKQQLFSRIIEATTRKELIGIFEVVANGYWKDHFTFGSVSRGRVKTLTPKFIDLLLINAILPLKFCYTASLGRPVNNQLVKIISEIKLEKNAIVVQFKSCGLLGNNAMYSQAMLQLYNAYCIKNKCLQCVVGMKLLNGK